MSAEQPAVFDPKNMELLDFIVADPKCTKANCNGRGYTGIQKDGTPVLCKCARMLETDKVRLKNDMKTMLDAQSAMLTKLFLLERQAFDIRSDVGELLFLAKRSEDRRLINRIKGLFR